MANGRLERGAKEAAAPITRARLKRFVETRRRSSMNTNLQFQIDAFAVGIKVEALGPARPFTADGFRGYQWDVETPTGKVTLIEYGGRNYFLSGDTDPHTRLMFELMKGAEFDVPAAET